jgi:RNA polymerase sigma-70 factor (ECF subfamily)
VPLAEAFQGGLGAVSPAAALTDSAALEAQLQAVIARGRAAYPQLPIDELTFVAHLARSVARRACDGPTTLEQLEAEDMYLAHACLQRVPGAVDAFDGRCGRRLRAVLATVAKSSELRAEAEQRVRDLLLVGTPDAPARIANYGGQAPLERWVAVVAQRQVVTMLRADATEQRARDGAALEAAVAAAAPAPELAYVKERYRGDFERAMSEALAALGERDQLLLRLHLVSGVSVESIGKMYGVSQSTASRWLAQARDAVSTHIERLLRERLRLSPDELASLAGLVASQIQVSISRLLKPPA